MSRTPKRRNEKQDDPLAIAEARIAEVRKQQATELDLSKLSLSELPESLDQLMQLTKLHLSDNQLTLLPESLGQLRQLTRLDIAGNQLTALPESLCRLTQLTALDLSRNRLTALPEWLGKLTLLTELYLFGNHLTSLPKSFSHLTRLRSLDLSHNGFAVLPEPIQKLVHLEHLSLAFNQINVFPESFGTLSQLSHLFLARNKLETIPESFVRLPQLEVLSIGGNLISHLPEWIENLSNLKCLDLSSDEDSIAWSTPDRWSIFLKVKLRGELKTLPNSLRKLTWLAQLYLHGNGKLDLPSEVLGPRWVDILKSKARPANPSDILDYYFRVQESGRALNEAKLILVGRGAVGKTSLVNRLVHNRFDKSEKKTEGIQITQWPLRLKRKEEVRLNIWDFGGQEIMHATHQFFLTQRSLYLLVLNGREGGEDADAEYWLKLIESFGAGSPVLIVLNKSKEHPFDLNRRALQQKYPNIRGFIATDCKDRTGLTELRKAIAHETDHLEHLRDAFPASWFSLKGKLAGMKKNYLSFEEYRKVCGKHGLKNSAEQESLAFVLHCLGIALNYKDDPRLQDTHVLNPHWVTTGIYKILNAQKLAEQKGVLRVQEVGKLLDAKKYPPAMHRFLFDLMKKFELCFTFLEEEGRYLIPDLLDKQEPEAASEFAQDDGLRFEYHYPILPEGLLPRFIVRTHVLSEGLPRWRSGVILQFEGNRGLVKADVQEKKVFITVTGPAAGRGRLLAIIRSDFERIHYDVFKTQPPLEMVPLPGHPQVVMPYEELRILDDGGEQEFKRVVGKEVLTFKVAELLNGVDLQGARKPATSFETQREAVRVFISYAHKDERLCNELIVHLKLMQRQGVIATWYDRKIEAGENWKEKIDENLERAEIILLLVSPHFMASDYCYEKEMQRGLERHANKEAEVIPIIVRDVSWKKAPFGKLQALPEKGKAVPLWKNKDSAWRSVAEGIERAAEARRAR
ncbi:leucine-rich repeat domain-containing protein [candidate division KSB1 bacterium]|nr:leucine-rich repeat domain-containing protein [candidate division KSB1 bacterium]